MINYIIRGIINDEKQKKKKRRNNSVDSLKLVFAIACQIDQIDDSMCVHPCEDPI